MTIAVQWINKFVDTGTHGKKILVLWALMSTSTNKKNTKKGSSEH